MGDRGIGLYRDGFEAVPILLDYIFSSLETKNAAIKAKVPPIQPNNSQMGKFLPLRLATKPAAVPTAKWSTIKKTIKGTLSVGNIILKTIVVINKNKTYTVRQQIEIFW